MLKLVLVSLVLYPQLVLANGFTSAQVLEWNRTSQDALFQNSVTMIGIVATQTGNHAHIARCISEETQAKGIEARHERIRAAMRKFPEHHPQAIILAVIEKTCGKF